MESLAGKKILCTGTFLGTRQQVNSYISGLSAIPMTSIQNSVDIIVIGEKPGRLKIDFALEKGKLIISEKEFYELTDVLPRYTTINQRATLRDFDKLIPTVYRNFTFNRDTTKIFGKNSVKIISTSGTIVSNKPKNFLKFEI
jgi:hypothetical protein